MFFSMQERFSILQHNDNELKIRYLESNNGDVQRRKHLVFIHGLGSSADRWLDIPDALSLYFHTIAIDLPGFGGSDKPQHIDYTIELFSDILTQFIKKIAITHENIIDDKSKTSLIGHSLGGYIASKIASSVNSIQFLD